MENIKKFQVLANDRPVELKRAKDGGKKIISYIGQYVPEEMIYAAGAEPYIMIKGGEGGPPDATLDYMLRFMNPFASSIAGYIIMGLDPVTPFTDLIVAQQLDNQIGRISELLEYFKLPIYKVGVPVEWEKDYAKEYYLNSLYKLKTKLEDVTGNTITDENLATEVKKSNKINELLRRFDELRKEKNPKISGTDFIKLNHYSLRTKPENAIDYLEKIYEETMVKEAIVKDGPRILMFGYMMAAGDYVVPTLIEDSGANIVADMFDEGLRWYRWDVKTEGNMVENIYERNYNERYPNSMFQPSWEDRFESLKALIKEYSVDAVVSYQLAFDEIYDMENTVLSKWLEEEKIPMLKLQTSYEYSREATGPLQTRIESFVESLKEGM